MGAPWHRHREHVTGEQPAEAVSTVTRVLHAALTHRPRGLQHHTRLCCAVIGMGRPWSASISMDQQPLLERLRRVGHRVVGGGMARDAQPSHAVLHALSCTGLVVSMSMHASPLLSLLWDGHSHRRHKLIDNLS